MRVFFCITVSMVLAVHHCIGSWIQVRRAFEQVRLDVKYPLPEFIDSKHLMRGVTVLEKCLKK